MALQRADRVQETSTTTGTGTYALGGAVAGYQAFSAPCANNDFIEYCATDGTNWEVGLGQWTTGNNLARITIYASSNSNAAVSWGAGSKNIFGTASASFLGTGGKASSIGVACAAANGNFVM